MSVHRGEGGERKEGGGGGVGGAESAVHLSKGGEGEGSESVV